MDEQQRRSTRLNLGVPPQRLYYVQPGLPAANFTPILPDSQGVNGPPHILNSTEFGATSTNNASSITSSQNETVIDLQQSQFFPDMSTIRNETPQNVPNIDGLVDSLASMVLARVGSRLSAQNNAIHDATVPASSAVAQVPVVLPSVPVMTQASNMLRPVIVTSPIPVASSFVPSVPPSVADMPQVHSTPRSVPVGPYVQLAPSAMTVTSQIYSAPRPTPITTTVQYVPPFTTGMSQAQTMYVQSAITPQTVASPIHEVTPPVQFIATESAAGPQVPFTSQAAYSGQNVTSPVNLPTVNTALPYNALVPNLYPLQHAYRPPMLRTLQDLPEFGGQPELWPQFLTAFNESTRTYQYTVTENHTRLMKALSGDAREAVEGLLIHPSNVNEVMETLRFRFGRSDLLVRSQLMKLKAIKELREDDFRGFIQYATRVKNMVALFLSAQTYNQVLNPTLLEELTARLPVTRKIEWARHVRGLGRDANVVDFSSWIVETANLLCIVDPPSSLNLSKTSRGQRLMFAGEDSVTDARECEKASDRVTTVDKSVEVRPRLVDSAPKPKGCPFCQDNHATVDCEKFKGLTLQEKWKWVRENRVCFSCVQRGHQVKKCPRNQRCSVEGCRYYHHPILHGFEPTQRQPTDNQPSLGIATNEQVAFRVLPVILSGPRAMVPTYALIDDGSCVSLMEKALVNELGLKGETDVLNLQWYDNRVTREEALVVRCQIQGVGQSKVYELKDVKAVESLSLPCQSLNLAQLKRQFPQLKEIPLQAYNEVKPRVLIGLNNARVAINKTVIECGANGPIVAETPLGWVLFGPVGTKSNGEQPILMMHQSSRDVQRQQQLDELKEQVQQYFNMEGFGLSVVPAVIESDEHQRARRLLKQTTIDTGGRFQTGLLWKIDNVKLPNNYESAVGRLNSLQKGLRKSPPEMEAYEKALMDYETKGYARKLEQDEVNKWHPRIWYLPHFGVKHPDKQKVRVVFDCTAVTKGQSLNSNLIAGPDLNQPLFRTLCRFREYPVAVQGDLQEMFCQVKIAPDDRHAQRYLWRPTEDSPIQVFEMTSMLFGAASSPCSALYVMQTNAERFVENYPKAVEAIKENHYIDDYLKSFETPEEAMTVTLQVKEIHAKGGFNLRRLVSNSPVVHQKISEEQSQESFNMNLTQSGERDKVLGMFWDRTADQFYFDFRFKRVPQEVRDGSRAPTKRELLSLVMSTFDPFGFLAHIMITAKLILQETWTDAIDWDDVLPSKLNDRVQNWLQCVTGLFTFRIPRCHCYFAHWVRLELHVFTDASDKAIAVVAYFRLFSRDQVIVSFVVGKTRCAPRKPMTTPRLELQAALLGSKIKQNIIDEHSVKIDQVFMWTDSKTVLLWINSEARNYRPFVMHRIAEILANTTIDEWYWVPTLLNPADDGTRPSENLTCGSTDRWITGPEFLQNKNFDWSTRPTDLNEWEQIEEVRKQSAALLLVKENDWLLNYSDYSTYVRMIRVLAYVLRACKMFKSHRLFAKTSPHVSCPKPSRYLKVDEVLNAEQTLCKRVQQEGLTREYSDLMAGESVDKKSIIYNVDPYMDAEGLIRCGSRINAAEFVPFDTRHPIVLPRGHTVTDMIISYYHAQCQHMFNETVICKIRQRFFVPHLRVELNRIRRNCQHCKEKNAQPEQPRMGPLHEFRLTPFLPPFTNTGLDYFGPVTITVNRHNEKRWVALFTCLNTRAIHLEIAHDYSTDALILCIRNFMNIRGQPRLVVSDRGSNFIGFNGEIANVPTFFDTGKIQEIFAPPKFNIDWRFNVAKDASAGGSWERMVQSVKRTLTTILKERHPKEPVLRSALMEAMNIVNSRPLTDVPVNPEDETPLTPNHFLIGHTNSTHTPGEVDNSHWDRKMWRQAQQLKDHFWHKWLQDYLPTLTRRSKWHKDVEPLAEGDLVFICDPDTSRNDWKRGRIIKVFPGKDGQVRSAMVKTAKGEYHRPAHKLAKLDVCSTSSHGGGDVAERDNDTCVVQRATPDESG